MISISVGFVTTSTALVMPSLVLTGLTGDVGIVGDTLSASLSDGTPITSYVWGSSPGAADYGTDSDLLIPAGAEDTTLYLFVQSTAGLFTTAVFVSAAPAAGSSVIAVGPDLIDVQSLAPLLAQPSLLLNSGTDTIIAETP